MSTAFSSTRQAAAFALLLLVLLALPAVMGRRLLPPREQQYSSAPWGMGSFPYLHDQIFEEKGDIDIAFMGSSVIWWGLDTPYVQEKLSEDLGRKAVVRTLGWNRNGYDALYFIMQDLLQHRKVRMIVVNDLSTLTSNLAQMQSWYWFRFGENSEALKGLPLRSKMSYYSTSMIGMPRDILGLIRSNLPVIPGPEMSWPGYPHVPNPALRLGSLAMRMGNLEYHNEFFPYKPQTNVDPSGTVVWSGDTKNLFEFSHEPLDILQFAFARKVAALAREHGTALVYLHIPDISESRSPVIKEQEFWPDVFNSNITMVGIPPAKLFAGLSDRQIINLFHGGSHLNQNGQEFFTPVVTPRLIEIYHDQTKP